MSSASHPIVKRIAVFLPSGAAPPDSVMHIPAIFEFVRQLSLRYEVHVYSFANPEYQGKTVKLGNALVRFLRTKWNDPIGKRFLSLLQAFYKDHRTTPFDLVHGMWAIPCGFFAVIAGKALRIPSVVSFLGGETAAIPSIPYGNMRSQPSRALTLFTGRHANAVVTLTEFQLRQLHQQNIDWPHAVTIPFGVDTNKFKPKRALRLKPPYRFIHVANLTEVKDQVTLLRTFKELCSDFDCRLWIIGGDFLNGRLQELARTLELEDRVEFLGFIRHEELPRYYRAAHIMLHTSLHEAEGVSIVEALASGLVVCGTKVGILSDLETGTISVDPGDYKNLAYQIKKLLNDKRQFSYLSQQGLAWATQHDQRWTIKKVSGMYERLLTKSVF